MVTDEEREKFFERIRKFFKLTEAKVVKEIPEDTFIIVTAVDDWNEEGNDMWQLPENKSYTRDVNCVECDRQVVMSNGVYKQFIDGGRVHKVLCNRCFVQIIKKDTE